MSLLTGLFFLLQSVILPGPGTPHTVGPTIAFVQGCVNSAAAVTTTCPMGSNITSGNLMVVAVKTQNSSGTATPTLTSSSGVTLSFVPVLAPSQTGGVNLFNSAIYAAIVPSTGAETVSVSWAGQSGSTFSDIAIAEYHTTTSWIAPQPDRSILTVNGTASTSCPTGTSPATNNPYNLIVAVAENFNSGQTWGSLAGFTNQAAASRNTVGWYSKSVTSTGTQAATIPLSASDGCVGMIAAFQSAGATQSCANCAIVQSTESAGTNVHNDPTTYPSPTTTGNMLVVFGVHSNFVSGVTTISDSNPANVWYPCGDTTHPAGGFTDINIGGGFGMSCHYAPAIQGVTGDTITINSTDCSTSTCTTAGGTYLEYSGPSISPSVAMDVYNTATGGTSTSGSNNATGAAITTTKINDLVISGMLNQSGTIAAGTLPIAWNQRQILSVAVEDAVWSSLGSISPTWTISSSGIGYGSISMGMK